jgi:hypothetical protein
LTITQQIQRRSGTLLAIVLFCSITLAGCRDFQDCRTPYKSFVKVAFQPINKGTDTPTIASIIDTATGTRIDSATATDIKPHTFELPLNCHTNTVQFAIDSSSSASPDTLTIHYQREAVLISHQCGCTYKYVLKKVTSTFAGKYKIINKELSTFNDSDIDVQIYF